MGSWSKDFRYLKKAIRLVGVAFTCVIVLGLITASIGRIWVEQRERQEAIASGITGLDFGGQTIPANQFKIGSRVKWPFVVEGYYSVPFDMHARIHATIYLVLPWGMYILSARVDHLA